jgi:hypothetical protein
MIESVKLEHNLQKIQAALLYAVNCANVEGDKTMFIARIEEVKELRRELNA